MRFFLGSWTGTGNGQPGASTVQREYRMTLNDRFIEVHNQSAYAPQPRNPKGELHEDRGMISWDKRRHRFVLRQFHVERFEMAEPESPFVIYSETRLKRVK